MADGTSWQCFGIRRRGRRKTSFKYGNTILNKTALVWSLGCETEVVHEVSSINEDSFETTVSKAGTCEKMIGLRDRAWIEGRESDV